MTGLGFLVFFAGYSFVVYGWSQLRGSNVPLSALVWPGKFTGNLDADKGSPDSSSSSTNTTPAGAPATKQAGGSPSSWPGLVTPIEGGKATVPVQGQLPPSKSGTY